MGNHPNSRQLLETIGRLHDLTPADGNDFWTVFWREVDTLPREVAVNLAAAIEYWAYNEDRPCKQEASLARQSRRHNEVSLDHLPADTIAGVAYISEDPKQIADEALLRLGSYQQRRCYLLFMLGLRQKAIATRMGVSQQRVSILLGQCREIVTSHYNQAKGWQMVWQAEVRGQALRADTDKEESKTQHTISKLRALRKDIRHIGYDRDHDPVYRMDGEFDLRSDQLETILKLGMVRTHRYGMVYLSRLAQLQVKKNAQKLAA